MINRATILGKTLYGADIYSHIIKEADAKAAECIADAYLRRPTKAM